jgi:magnesium transporter
VEVLTTVDEGRLRRLLAGDEFFWLDLVEPPADALDAVRSLLGLHAAAIEDSREWNQLPKVDDYGDHLLIVFYTAGIGDDGRAHPFEVHVYLSGRFIVTARRHRTGLDRLHGLLQEEETDCEDLIVYRILDTLADGWDPIIDALDDRVDTVENDVLARTRQSQLTAIYRLRQEMGELLRRAWRQSQMMPDAIERIHHLPGLTRGSREWLRDVEAHTESIASDLRRLTGDLTALTDTFFNANANRLNRLATLVAVGSLFFLIWTLVTGFFGQNFGFLVRHINSEATFLIYEIGGLVIPTLVLAVVLWWRRRDWWS